MTGACSACSSCASSALRCRGQAVLRLCPAQVADHISRRSDLAVECLQEGHVPCVRHASLKLPSRGCAETLPHSFGLADRRVSRLWEGLHCVYALQLESCSTAAVVRAPP